MGFATLNPSSWIRALNANASQASTHPFPRGRFALAPRQAFDVCRVLFRNSQIGHRAETTHSWLCGQTVLISSKARYPGA
jgi:hypothetical protein